MKIYKIKPFDGHKFSDYAVDESFRVLKANGKCYNENCKMTYRVLKPYPGSENVYVLESDSWQPVLLLLDEILDNLIM